MRLVCRCGAEIDYDTSITNEINEAFKWKNKHTNCLDLEELDIKLERAVAVSEKCITLINQLASNLEDENKLLN